MGLATALLVANGAAQAAVIGPDAFGYTATDEVPFAFRDIGTTGTPVLAGTDDQAVAISLPFAFDFYGTRYTTAFVSSNGLLSFGAPNDSFANVSLTGPVVPDRPTIAVLWDDWSFVPTGPTDAVRLQALGAPGGREFVVQWNRARSFLGPQGNTVTFQAILFEDSRDILLQYADVLTGDFRDRGGSATVGIRDVAGHTNGRNLQWSFNQFAIRDGQAIRISAAVIPEPGGLTLGGIGLVGLAGYGWWRRRRVVSGG